MDGADDGQAQRGGFDAARISASSPAALLITVCAVSVLATWSPGMTLLLVVLNDSRQHFHQGLLFLTTPIRPMPFFPVAHGGQPSRFFDDHQVGVEKPDLYVLDFG